jgi:hypothetical protein
MMLIGRVKVRKTMKKLKFYRRIQHSSARLQAFWDVIELQRYIVEGQSHRREIQFLCCFHGW